MPPISGFLSKDYFHSLTIQMNLGWTCPLVTCFLFRHDKLHETQSYQSCLALLCEWPNCGDTVVGKHTHLKLHFVSGLLTFKTPGPVCLSIGTFTLDLEKKFELLAFIKVIVNSINPLTWAYLVRGLTWTTLRTQCWSNTVSLLANNFDFLIVSAKKVMEM